jgi:plasmid stabilization system protein ParE
MAEYLLSQRAQQSLVQTSQYTLDHFSERQKKRCLKMLRERMRTAAKKPEKGKVRMPLKPVITAYKLNNTISIIVSAILV